MVCIHVETDEIPPIFFFNARGYPSSNKIPLVCVVEVGENTSNQMLTNLNLAHQNFVLWDCGLRITDLKSSSYSLWLTYLF